MTSVDEGELNLLAVHAGVGLRVGDPDGRVLRGGLFPGLSQQIIDALRRDNLKGISYEKGKIYMHKSRKKEIIEWLNLHNISSP